MTVPEGGYPASYKELASIDYDAPCPCGQHDGEWTSVLVEAVQTFGVKSSIQVFTEARITCPITGGSYTEMQR